MMNSGRGESQEQSMPELNQHVAAQRGEPIEVAVVLRRRGGALAATARASSTAVSRRDIGGHVRC